MIRCFDVATWQEESTAAEDFILDQLDAEPEEVETIHVHGMKTTAWSEEEIRRNTFQVDSGSNRHAMVSNDGMTNYREKHGKIDAAIEGNPSTDMIGVGDFGMLEDVVHAPKVKGNFISVSMFNKDGGQIIFTADKGVGINKHGQTVFIADLYPDNLYRATRESMLACKVNTMRIREVLDE